MKKLLKKVYAGISGKKDQTGNYHITVDFEKNSPEDIIQFLNPYKTKLQDHIYWFGYKYKEGIEDKRLYNAFIDFIKTVQEDDSVEYIEQDGVNIPYSPDHITESELDSMIIRSFNSIGISKYNIDTVVYPGSSNHNIVNVMIKCIKKYFKDSDKMNFAQLTKLASNKVQLDRKQFVADLLDGVDDLKGLDVRTIYTLQQELEENGEQPFSIRKDIHPKQLRRYVKEIFDNESEKSLIEAKRVLVVDDFKTTGTTILDIIDKIEKVNTNDDLDIYIFTLMGNFKG